MRARAPKAFRGALGRRTGHARQNIRQRTTSATIRTRSVDIASLDTAGNWAWSRAQRASTGSSGNEGVSNTMYLTCSHSSCRCERHTPDVCSNSPRPIHSSPSSAKSRGSCSRNHRGAFHSFPRRDQSRCPSHSARTPSSFSLIHQSVGSSASPVRRGAPSLRVGHVLASSRCTRWSWRPMTRISPCTSMEMVSSPGFPSSGACRPVDRLGVVGADVRRFFWGVEGLSGEECWSKSWRAT